MSAIAERSYGIGKPMQMIMREAPNAGKEAQRVWEKGKPAEELLLFPDRKIGVEEAIRNSFAFVQIAGMKAGESSTVANISTGLTWDRQTPIENCAQEIVKNIGGSEVQFVWFGPHKLVGFVKGDEQPEEKQQAAFRQATVARVYTASHCFSRWTVWQRPPFHPTQ